MNYAVFRKVPARRRKPPEMQHKAFVAPTGGWVSAANLAQSPPGTAQVLENFMPTTTGIRMRSGSSKFGTASTTDPLESLMAYIGSASRKMFGAAGGKIFEFTSPASPTVPPTADVSGRTDDYYASVNFANVGGNWMYAVNDGGADKALLYDGTSWLAVTTSSSPISVTGVDTKLWSHVNAYRNRLWFVRGGTMIVDYLAIDAVGGAVAGQVSLAGVFRRGGAVLFTATWSMDAGDGLDDKFVVASTEGEFAVFQGGDPGDPDDWGLVGRYDAAKPLGKNAFLAVGGDLLVLTEIGLVPMSQIQVKDPGALALASISKNIQPDWVADARQRRSLPWEIQKWTSKGFAYISNPVTADEGITPPWCYAVNLETGAWTKITGWNTRCLVVHADQLYFGTNAGTLIEADITGADDGAIINYTYVGQNDHLGTVGQTKTIRQVRAIFRARNDFIPQLSVSTDYVPNLPSPPDAAPIGTSPGVWDVGLWDVAQWDTGQSFYVVQTQWVSIGETGFVHAPQLQISSGSQAAPTAELVTYEVTYELAGIVV